MKKTRSNTFILENEKAWNPPVKASFARYWDMTVRLCSLKSNLSKVQWAPLTPTIHTQTTYVASGKFEFTVNGEKQIVSAGDGVYIEPDAEHGCTCLEAGILIDCFSPMRADFLKETR